jgi:hypothetical protein
MYNVKDLSTGKIHSWTIDQILAEINRDHSSEWTDYDKTDWREGWNEWCEGDVYSLLN